MRYFLFRLSLDERQLPELLAYLARDERPSRQQYLMAAFTANFDFIGHGGKPLDYVFKGVVDGVVGGRIGRPKAMGQTLDLKKRKTWTGRPLTFLLTQRTTQIMARF